MFTNVRSWVIVTGRQRQRWTRRSGKSVESWERIVEERRAREHTERSLKRKQDGGRRVGWAGGREGGWNADDTQRGAGSTRQVATPQDSRRRFLRRRSRPNRRLNDGVVSWFLPYRTRTTTAIPGDDNHGVLPRRLRELRSPRGHGRSTARHASHTVCIRRVSQSFLYA